MLIELAKNAISRTLRRSYRSAHGKARGSVVFALAIGIEDRPERWHTPGMFFVRLGDVLERCGIDCYYAAHPAIKLGWLEQRTSFRIGDHAEFKRRVKPLRPDYVFVWSGNSPADRETIRVAEALGARPVFAEIGWFPQKDTIYFDFEGTNFRSGIRRLNLDTLPVDPRLDAWLVAYLNDPIGARLVEGEYLFVPLQDEQDTNITQASPYRCMNDLVRDLSETFPRERFVVRRHPRFMDVQLDEYPNVTYRNDGHPYDWLRHAKATIGINSTVLLEALLFDAPVYAVGEGLASGLGVLREFPNARALSLGGAPTATERDRRRRLLSELIFRRMLRREDLDDAETLRRHPVLGEVLALGHRNVQQEESDASMA